MTTNHLLLYRLAELMLEYEQHVLPVDLLFDDDQIGEFVKSIQIDSPYQQMLFEGVLTESIKDEILYVSFTVEAYFHFVLGEVIYQKAKGKDGEYLKQFIETVKLNGAVEGIKECLIRDIKNDNLTRLIALIDIGGKIMDSCIVPLSYAFVQNDFHEESILISRRNKIEFVLNKLLEYPTKNDLKVLHNSILHLEENLKNEIVELIFNLINNFVKSDSVEGLILLAKSIQFIPAEKRLEQVDQLLMDLEKIENENHYLEILVELGSQYYFFTRYDKAINCYNKSLSKIDKKRNDYKAKQQKIYTNLGAAYWRKEDFESAYQYFNESYLVSIELYGENHPTTALTIHNLALIEASLEKYDNAISYFKKSLQIDQSFYGKKHSITSRTYSNLGSCFLQKGDYFTANDYFQKSLSIDLKLFDEKHPNLGLDYDDIGDVCAGLNDFENAKKYYKKALEIFSFSYGLEYSHSKLLSEKLNKIND